MVTPNNVIDLSFFLLIVFFVSYFFTRFLGTMMRALIKVRPHEETIIRVGVLLIYVAFMFCLIEAMSDYFDLFFFFIVGF
jgi:hypothetical protein